MLKAERSKLKARKIEGISLMKFAYEDLEVWNKAVDFAVKVIDTVDD